MLRYQLTAQLEDRRQALICRTAWQAGIDSGWFCLWCANSLMYLMLPPEITMRLFSEYWQAPLPMYAFSARRFAAALILQIMMPEETHFILDDIFPYT
jgi:hypothetical protein